MLASAGPTALESIASPPPPLLSLSLYTPISIKCWSGDSPRWGHTAPKEVGDSASPDVQTLQSTSPAGNGHCGSSDPLRAIRLAPAFREHIPLQGSCKLIKCMLRGFYTLSRKDLAQPLAAYLSGQIQTVRRTPSSPLLPSASHELHINLCPFICIDFPRLTPHSRLFYNFCLWNEKKTSFLRIERI